MLISLKKYIKCLGYRLRTKIDVDSDFYDHECFYLIDLERD